MVGAMSLGPYFTFISAPSFGLCEEMESKKNDIERVYYSPMKKHNEIAGLRAANAAAENQVKARGEKIARLTAQVERLRALVETAFKEGVDVHNPSSDYSMTNAEIDEAYQGSYARKALEDES